jgi:hypothetical protein
MLLALVALSPAVRFVAAAEPTAPSDREAVVRPGASIAYRRAFVPQDDPRRWPTAGEPYVPLRREEFERLLRLAGSRQANPSQPAQRPVIRSAMYRARLDDDCLVGYDSHWLIEVVDPDSRMLSIATNLAIGQLGWESTAADPAKTNANAKGRPLSPPLADARPLLGLTAAGNQALLLPGSGRVRFEWSRRGQGDPEQAMHFTLAIPCAVSSELELLLPPRWVPQLNGDTVVKRGNPEGELQLWQCQLGTASMAKLELVDRDRAAGGQPASGVHEQLTYDISERGLELAAEFEIDSPLGQINQLRYTVDADLTVLGASVGETALNWSISSPGPDHTRLVTVSLAERLLAEKRVVRILAIARPRLDQKCRLPTIRPSGLYFRDGNVVCRILSPLVVTEISGKGCRQVSGGPLPAPLMGDSLEFETFDPDRAIELTLRRQTPGVQFATATTASVTPSEFVAATTCRGTVAGEDLLHLSAQITPGWVIDSVEASGELELSHWEVDASTPPQRVKLAFLKSPASGQVLELRFIGHRSNWVLGQELQLADMIPIAVSGRPQDRYLSLELNPELKLRVPPDRRLLPAQPPPELRTPTTSHETPAAYQVDLATAGTTVVIEKEKPAFAVSVHVEASLRDESLSHNYRIVCSPSGMPIDKIRVRFTPAAGQLRWQSKTSDGTPIHVRQLDSPPDGSLELWEITLARPRGDEFALSAWRIGAWTSQTEIVLAGVEAATVASGTLSLAAPSRLPVEIDYRGLEPIPLGTDAASGSDRPRARYAYDPAGVSRAGQGASLVIRRREERGQSGAIIWRAALFSSLAPTGAGEHYARYEIENFDLEELDFDLTPAARVTTVLVNDKPLRAQQSGARLAVSLPRDQRYLAIGIHLTTTGPSWKIRGTIGPAALQPAAPIPILFSTWHLAISPDYCIAAGDQRPGAVQPTIGQRLFGIFGRSSSNSRFHPLSRQSWSRLVTLRGEDDLALASARIVQQLASAAYGVQPVGTWGQAVAHWAKLLQQNGIALLVDRSEVESLGIGPQTPILAAPEADSLLAQAKMLLRQANLALVVGPKTILLTTALAAALATQGGQLRVIDPGYTYEPEPPWVGQALDGGTILDGDQLLPAALWAQRGRGPWLAGAGVPLPDQIGNKRYLLINAPPDMTMRVVNVRLLAALGWIALLVGIALGASVLGSRPRVLLFFIGIAVIVALLIPGEYTSLASGVLVGLLGGALWSWSRLVASRTPPRDSPAHAPSRHLARVVGASLGIVVAANFSAACAAAETNGAPKESDYRVLIPVDSHRQPVGNYYYLPLEMLEQVRQQIAQRGGLANSWLLGEALYRGQFRWDPSHRRLDIAELQAMYDLQTFEDSTAVTLPNFLGSAGIPPRLLLDGQAVTVTTNAKKELLVAVPRAGLHSLEITLAPTIERTPESSRFHLSLPSVANARAVFSLPADAPGVRMHAPDGQVAAHYDGTFLVARLGAIDQLQVEWFDQAGVEAAGAPELEEFLWLTIKPGGVALDTKFKFARHSVDRLEISVPSQLRLVPDETNAEIVPSIATSAKQQQTLEFRLPPDRLDAAELTASFLVADFAGIGHLRLPELRPLSGCVVRKWLALSVDPALVIDDTGLSAAKAITTSEWAAAWGASDTAPQRAYLLPLDRQAWSIVARPMEPQITAASELVVTAARRGLYVEYRAQLDAREVRFFQHRLRVPKDLQIETLALKSGNSPQSARWSKNDELLTVLPTSAPVGEHVLTFSGTLPVPPDGEIALPTIRLLDAKEASGEVILRRHRDTLVALADAVNLVPRGGSVQASNAAEQPIVVERYSATAPDYAARLLLTANAPKVRATQVTAAVWSAGHWTTRITCDFQVNDGIMDEVRFQVPPAWKGSFHSRPQCLLQVVTAADGMRQLLVRPPRPVTGSFRLVLEAPFQGGPEAFEPVVLVPLLAGPTRQFVALPRSAEGRPLRWSRQGLRASGPPDGFELADEAEFYEASGATFSAALAGGAKRDKPQVQSQLNCLMVGAAGDYRGLSTFDIEPQGHASCRLLVPGQLAIAQVVLDGAPAVVAREKPQWWRIDLRSSRLPQRLQVYYQGPPLPSTLIAPRVDGQAPRQVLWDVRTAGELSVTADRLSPGELGLLRCRAAVELLDRVAATALADELPDAFRTWWARYEQTLHLVRESAGGAASRQFDAPLQRLEKRAQQLKGRVAPTGQIGAPAEQQQSAIELWLTAARPHTAQYCFATAGDQPRAEIAPIVPTNNPLGRWGLSVLIIAIIFGMWRYGWDTALFDWLVRWPQMAGVAIGALWWFFLAPSSIGWLLLVLSLVALALRLVLARGRENNPLAAET